jgi:hypothetical protein
MNEDAAEQLGSTLSCNSRRVRALLRDGNSGKPSTRGQLIWFQATIPAPSLTPVGRYNPSSSLCALIPGNRWESTALVKSYVPGKPVSCHFRILPYFLSTLSWFILRRYQNPIHEPEKFPWLLRHSIVTGYGLEERVVGVRVPVWSRIFSTSSRPALGFT